ncbi:IclR family transcriptional regulator [Leucobacter sp. W1038]|uniref:IclR family transcriptional regulator n=1 Tax=Leucobacter sp. W1038 TaxID=3438281 RepID=UPI003D983CFC
MANSSSGESVIERFLRVLEAFDFGHRTLNLSQIAVRASLPLSTAHRLTAEMVKVGALNRSATGAYEVGARMWELSSRSSEIQRLREAALPAMLDVQRVVRQHTNLAIREDDQVLYLERLSAPSATPSIAMTASRLPLGLTSSGLVLLAFGSRADADAYLSQERGSGTPGSRLVAEVLVERVRDVRRDGYCITDGYRVSSSIGVAVPVLYNGGRALAALNVIVPSAAGHPQNIVPTLLQAAQRISEALGSQ